MEYSLNKDKGSLLSPEQVVGISRKKEESLFTRIFSRVSSQVKYIKQEERLLWTRISSGLSEQVMYIKKEERNFVDKRIVKII